MATQQDYDVGTAAVVTVLQSDLTQIVPSWAQSWIPPNEVQQVSPAIAKAVIDAVDAYRVAQIHP